MTDVQPGKPTHPPFDPETVPALEQVRARRTSRRSALSWPRGFPVWNRST